jgi:hypothetical protein
MTIHTRSRLMAGTSMSLAAPRKGLVAGMTRRPMRDETGHEEAAAAAAAREAEAARAREAEAAAAAAAAAAAGNEDAAEIERLRAELARRDASLATFEGLDPAEAKAAIAAKAANEAAQRDAERAKAEADGNWERVRELMVQEHEAEKQRLISERDAERSGKTAAEQRADTLTADRAFGESKFISEKVTLPIGKVRQLYGAHVDVENGVPVVYTKPRGEQGRTKIVDAKGQPMEFNAAIEKVITSDPDKDKLLASEVKPGGGSRSDQRGQADLNKSRHQRMAEGLASLKK